MEQGIKKYIVIFLGICLFWLLGIPMIFSKVTPVVCENISHNSEYIIQIKKPSIILNVLPFAIIKAEELTIKDKISGEYITVKSPRAKIRLLPLISGTVHINKISSEGITLNSDINADPKLDKEFFSELKKHKVWCDCASFENLNIRLNPDDNSKPIFYKAEKTYYRKNGRFIKLDVKSELKLEGKDSQINAKLYLPKNNNIRKSVVNVNILNLDIEPIGDFLKNYLPSDIVKVRGTVDIDISKNHMNGILSDCAVIMKDEAKSMIFPKVLRINSDLNLTRKTIAISQSEILSDNINLNIAGTINNYLEKTLPSINLNLRIAQSRIEDFISMFPAIKTEDIDLYKLKKYKFMGDIIGNLTIKGDNYEPSIIGDIFINNGILMERIPNAGGAVIKLKFLGKHLNYDVYVPAGLGEYVSVIGGVELYNVKYADMVVKSSKNVNLAVAESKVNPLHEILNFVVGPVPIMDINGTGNIDIAIKGNRRTPHVWGTLNFKDVTTNFNDIPDFVLKDAEAVLTFDDENSVFNLIKGNVNEKPVNITGTCTTQGKFDFNFSSKNQNLSYLYDAIYNSKDIVKEFKNILPKLNKKDGLANVDLKIYGNSKYIEDLAFNRNFFVKGQIALLGNTFSYDDYKLEKTQGTIDFEGLNANAKLKSYIGKSPVDIKVAIKDRIADLNIDIPKFNLKDGLEQYEIIPKDMAGIILSLNAKYKGSADKISYENIDLKSSILGVDSHNKLQVSSGDIYIKNGKLQIKNLKGNFEGTKSLFDINILADSLMLNPSYNGTVKLENFDLTLLNILGEYAILPDNLRDIFRKIQFERGKINLNASVKSNIINASTNLGGVSLIYTPLNIPIKIVNGSIYSRKNNIGLHKINIIADGMPILVDGNVNDIFAKKDFNLYLNSKPNQKFLDDYINKEFIYPIKVKGDVLCSARLKGEPDNFDISANIELDKDSNIYYMGATVGDTDSPLGLDLNMNVNKKKFLKVKEFSYDKVQTTPNSRLSRLNMLKVSGGIDLIDNDIKFHDLRIKTTNPTDAKIFNIIFRKPNIKQGQFVSDLKLNGKLSNPKILGTFKIVETNIPFLDIIINKIDIFFKDKTINISSNGEVLGNEIVFKGLLKNKLSIPYYIENADLYTKEINLNHAIDKLKMSHVDSDATPDSYENFDLSSLVIKNLNIHSDLVKLRNIVAKEVAAKVSINENKDLNISNINFKIADGTLNGDFSYNLSNNKTGLRLQASSIDANAISYAIFDLDNQIYGDLTGKIEVSCNGQNYDKCMETLNGRTEFNVLNGRMPKLGSLEYLLRAGNLIKGGITNLSINGVIDIITPLKTGNFSEIRGKMDIKNGVTDNIEITTQGKDLSLFISGQYNFATSEAEMDILGQLTRKISTMFGPIGNLSINTLFNVIPGIDLTKESKVLEKINKIPGVELSGKAYRRFIVDIKGNINGDDYVKSFRWIN